MSQESDEKQEMRAEYDIRGGVRGKYFRSYGEAAIHIAFEETSLIAVSTTSTPLICSITRAAVYPPAFPSPKVRVGSHEAVRIA